MWSVRTSRELATAMRVLPDEERIAIERVIGRLVLGPFPSGSPEAQQLDADGNSYAVRAGPRYWVTYLIEPGDVIVVDDIISQDTIRKYLAPVAQ